MLSIVSKVMGEADAGPESPRSRSTELETASTARTIPDSVSAEQIRIRGKQPARGIRLRPAHTQLSGDGAIIGVSSFHPE